MFDESFYFCANPVCPLHVRAGDVGVRGSGNWAMLGDGVMIGRSRVDGFMLCDRCARSAIRGELKVPTGRA